MPCDYRILQSPTKGQVLLVLLETVQRSLVGYWRNDIPLQKVKQKTFGGHVTYGVFCGVKHWKSGINEVKVKHTFPIFKTTAKSVQTSAVVCADYTCSLQKVLRTYKFKYAYSRK